MPTVCSSLLYSQIGTHNVCKTKPKSKNFCQFGHRISAVFVGSAEAMLKTSLEDFCQRSETSPFIKFQRSLTFGASLIIWIRIRTSSISGFCGISSIFYIKLVLNFAFEPTIFNLYRNSFRFSHDFPKVSQKFSSFFHKVLRTENVFCVYETNFTVFRPYKILRFDCNTCFMKVLI